MKIKLDFEDSTKISDGSENNLSLTFWNGNLFRFAQNNEPIKNGA